MLHCECTTKSWTVLLASQPSTPNLYGPLSFPCIRRLYLQKTAQGRNASMQNFGKGASSEEEGR